MSDHSGDKSWGEMVTDRLKRIEERLDELEQRTAGLRVYGPPPGSGKPSLLMAFGPTAREDIEVMRRILDKNKAEGEG